MTGKSAPAFQDGELVASTAHGRTAAELSRGWRLYVIFKPT